MPWGDREGGKGRAREREKRNGGMEKEMEQIRKMTGKREREIRIDFHLAFVLLSLSGIF